MYKYNKYARIFHVDNKNARGGATYDDKYKS